MKIRYAGWLLLCATWAHASTPGEASLRQSLDRLCHGTFAPTPSGEGCADVAAQWQRCGAAGERCGRRERGRIVALAVRLESPLAGGIALEVADSLEAQARQWDDLDRLAHDPLYSLARQAAMLGAQERVLDAARLGGGDRALLHAAGVALAGPTPGSPPYGDACTVLSSPALPRLLRQASARSALAAATVAVLGGRDAPQALCAATLVDRHWSSFTSSQRRSFLDWLASALAVAAARPASSDAASADVLLRAVAWQTAVRRDRIAAALVQWASVQGTPGLGASLGAVSTSLGLLARPLPERMDEDGETLEPVETISGTPDRRTRAALLSDPTLPQIAPRMSHGELVALIEESARLCAGDPAATAGSALEKAVDATGDATLRFAARRSCAVAASDAGAPPDGLSGLQRTAWFATVGRNSPVATSAAAFDAALDADDPWLARAAAWNLAAACGIALPAVSPGPVDPLRLVGSKQRQLGECGVFRELSEASRGRVSKPR